METTRITGCLVVAGLLALPVSAAGPFVEDDAVTLYPLEGEAVGDGFGWVGNDLGDLNGDGDVIVAAYNASDGGPAAGKATIFSGRDASPLRTITGAVPYDNLGVDAFALGDVNGDGATDLVITAVGLDFLLQDVGRAYVVAGNR